jgi:SAM-dependent methyltransferase
MAGAQAIQQAYAKLAPRCDPRFFTNAASADGYLRFHASRFVDTVASLRGLVPAGAHVLEVGSRPYLLSLLVRDELGVAVDGVNDGPTEEYEGIHTYGLNLEKGRVPRPDGYYDLVLLCEVFEHLLDPSAVLTEVNRLLRAEGRMFLSTPNAAALAKALSLLAGRNVYHGLSATSPYARHNREYTAGELRRALPGFGFRIDRLDLRNYRDLRGHPAPRVDYLTAIWPSRRRRLDLLCTKVGPVTDPHPPSIYRRPDVDYHD